jgi:hypothetical protein
LGKAFGAILKMAVTMAYVQYGFTLPAISATGINGSHFNKPRSCIITLKKPPVDTRGLIRPIPSWVFETKIGWLVSALHKF